MRGRVASLRDVLYLVRHAMPVTRAEVPPETWHLGPEGRTAASALMRTLPPGPRLFSSDEPKALETVGGSAGVTPDPRFREVTRPREEWEGNYLERRRRYVAGTSHPGWELQADAAERFQAGVAAIEHDELADGDERPVVIATHGMVLTTWLVSVGAVRQSRAAEFWSDLRFPDCFVVGPSEKAVRRHP
jgi:broad specificity phosphatase PhoE